MIRVLAQRDDLMMVGDPNAGLGVILYRPGQDPQVVHRDTAYAAGYWADADGPLPPLPRPLLDELTDFNDRFPPMGV